MSSHLYKPQAIPAIFRGPFLERIARDKHQSALLALGAYCAPLSPPSVSEPLKDWFEFFYSLLLGQYQCEYVYKNAVATDLYLAARPSLDKSVLTGEFRSGQSRADVVIVNNTSTVYEVKTKYDSLQRLEGQIADYKDVFDRIVVVTTAAKTQAVLGKVEARVGLMVLGEDGKLNEIREAQSNKAHTDPAKIFDCMRQAESISAIQAVCGYVPRVPNSKLYRELKELFCRLAPDEAHDVMVSKVRMRGKRKPFADLINAAPNSLKHACLSFSTSQAMAVQIRERLKEPLLK